MSNTVCSCEFLDFANCVTFNLTIIFEKSIKIMLLATWTISVYFWEIKAQAFGEIELFLWSKSRHVEFHLFFRQKIWKIHKYLVVWPFLPTYVANLAGQIDILFDTCTYLMKIVTLKCTISHSHLSKDLIIKKLLITCILLLVTALLFFLLKLEWMSFQ